MSRAKTFGSTHLSPYLARASEGHVVVAKSWLARSTESPMIDRVKIQYPIGNTAVLCSASLLHLKGHDVGCATGIVPWGYWYRTSSYPQSKSTSQTAQEASRYLIILAAGRPL